MSKPRAWVGFTLIELVVAIAIFSVMAVFGYEGLRNFIAQRAQVDTQQERFMSLVSAYALIAQDLTSVVPRSIRDELGDSVAAVRGTAGAQTTLALTRQSGWAPVAEGTSDLRRIEYRVENTTLIRRTWEVLDRLPDSSYVDKVLLPEVKAWHVQYFNDTGWVEEWPQTRGVPGLNLLPRAVEVVLEFTNGRTLERVFLLSGAG